MVMEGIQEDMGDGNLICTNHPYKNSTPGGICAFCLQEKLGKLVSSSFPASIFPATSSSSATTPFRSDFGNTSNTTSSSSTLQIQTNILQTNGQTKDCNFTNAGNHYDTMRKSRMPFLLTHKKNKKDGNRSNGSSSSSSVMASTSSASNVGTAMKRSKSTTTPRNHMHFLDNADEEDYTPHRKRFWSFLYYSSTKNSYSTAKKTVKDLSFPSSSSSVNVSMRSRDKKKEEFVVVEENESPNEAAFDRKVSRSRSVGCGSRSFSGDFFERISTGFGDCTLRRVESQREGKSKVSSVHRGNGATRQDCIKERVRCGGIFSGFMITSSSSSSSSSSHWVSSEENVNGKSTTIAPASVGRQLVHGRNKSWGWAFASPMRAFSSKSSSSSNGKRDASNKNATPNLAAIPSLLTARG